MAFDFPRGLSGHAVLGLAWCLTAFSAGALGAVVTGGVADGNGEGREAARSEFDEGRALEAPPPAPSPLAWTRLAFAPRASGVEAVAYDPRADRLALGDHQGVVIATAGGAFRRVAHHGPVKDLLFLADGSLLAATPRGLVEITAGRAGVPQAPGPGESARLVERLSSAGGYVAAATGNSVYVSRDGRRWQRLTGALPTGAATAVALRVETGAVECWSVIAGQLWRAELILANGDIRIRSAEREVIAFAGRDGGAVDVVADLSETALAVVFARALALARSDTALATGSDWEIVRPSLPAGGALLRLGRGAGRFWLATDHGLLVAGSLRGPWGRAAPPAGTARIQTAAASKAAIFVAANTGVLAGHERAAGPAGAGTAAAARGESVATGSSASIAGETQPGVAAFDPSREPPVAAVHRAAIDYLGLGRSRLEAMRAGVMRRGWWPLVALRGGADWDRRRTRELDESLASGETYDLIDRDRVRDLAYGASLTLSWDLGGIVYEPEAIDVSRETREVIELRDDVLDEVTQLYFERRRILSSLYADGTGRVGGESLQLRQRADELAAGIDAWTGGWFSAQVAPLSP